MKRQILQAPNKILRKISAEVPLQVIPEEKIKKIIFNMSSALLATTHGVALAAPQIGESVRIFIVDLNERTGEKNSPKKPFLVFINPEILRLSKKKSSLSEGCLSVEDRYGMVKRSDKIVVEAYDADGKKFKRGASGLLSQIIQHEVDHLNGILFTDKARNLVYIPPEENKDE